MFMCGILHTIFSCLLFGWLSRCLSPLIRLTPVHRRLRILLRHCISFRRSHALCEGFCEQMERCTLTVDSWEQMTVERDVHPQEVD